MKKKINKAIIDDGCNPELVALAMFDGIMSMPLIKKPEEFIIPSGIVPFSKMKYEHNEKFAIGFYEHDVNWAEVLKSPENFVDDFKKYVALITPDCSLYRNAPLPVQVINIYRNRMIGSFYQEKGVYVIPQIRWGNEYTYTTKYFPEKIAFLGVEKHSIVAIGTYGCIKTLDDKYHFKCGLKEMLETLEPEIVLVYGAMPKSVFGEFMNKTRFIHYSDWTTLAHQKEKNNG